jgi:hypothetical protein
MPYSIVLVELMLLHLAAHDLDMLTRNLGTFHILVEDFVPEAVHHQAVVCRILIVNAQAECCMFVTVCGNPTTWNLISRLQRS